MVFNYVSMQGVPLYVPAVIGDLALQSSNNVDITGGSISNITDLAIADGGTGASTPAGARTNLELGSAAQADLSQGTWTPAYFLTTSGSVTVGAASTGSWFRIGNWVFFSGYLLASAISSPVGTVQISLPFAAKAGNTYYPVSINVALEWATDMPNFRGFITTSATTTHFLLVKNSSGAGFAAVVASDLAATGNQIVFGGWYEVAT